MPSAIISAVPLGASSLRLWCISTISMSKSLPSAAAALLASEMSTLIPSDILPEENTGMCAAASRICARSASVWPVVAITAGRRLSSAYARILGSNAWLEKSMMQSTRSRTASKESYTGMPDTSPACTSTPQTTRTSVSAADSTSCLPIRPQMPQISTPVISFPPFSAKGRISGEPKRASRSPPRSFPPAAAASRAGRRPASPSRS